MKNNPDFDRYTADGDITKEYSDALFAANRDDNALRAARGNKEKRKNPDSDNTKEHNNRTALAFSPGSDMAEPVPTRPLPEVKDPPTEKETYEFWHNQ